MTAAMASCWRARSTSACSFSFRFSASLLRAASTAVPSNAVRGAAYDMPAERIEDNAVEAVYDAAGRAVARERDGGSGVHRRRRD